MVNRIEKAEARVTSKRLPDMRGHSFVSIDPGTAYYGWAVWNANGALIDCGYSPDLRKRDWAHACVIEKPVCYPGSPVRPQDIVNLAYSAGLIAGQYYKQASVEPRAWKGTTDGTKFLTRIRAVLTKREPHERFVVQEALALLPKSKHEHVLDAIGLGLVVQGVRI